MICTPCTKAEHKKCEWPGSCCCQHKPRNQTPAEAPPLSAEAPPDKKGTT